MPARSTHRTTDVPFAMLRASTVGGAVMIPVSGVVAAAARGERAGLQSAAGAITAVAFLTIGLVAITGLVRGAGSLVLPVALVLYVTLAALLFAVLHRVDSWSGVDRVAFAVGAAAAVLAWQVGATGAYLRGRHEIYAGQGRS